MPTLSRHDTVPGPSGSPLLGMTRHLQRDLLGTLRSAMLEHGGVARLVVGPPGLRLPLYLVSHPDGVRRVLAENAAGYSKQTPVFREMAAYFGNGLVISDGQEWRQQRRMIAPLFTRRRIARYAEDMIREAAVLADRWAEAGSVDLHTEMSEYALRVVTQTLFGSGFAAVSPVLRRTFPLVSDHAVRRGLNPLRLPRNWPTPAARRAAQAQREMFAVVDDIIRERRRQTPGDDMVSLLLAARDPETGAALTDREVRDQALIFLLAGHETTATVLTFACQLIGAHPDVQHQVSQEIDAVLGGARPTPDDLGALTYTTMAVKEVLRLYPSVHATSRVASADDVIGEHRIRAGSTMLISPWVTHRYPGFWPDPERFNPDRFRPEAESGRHRYAYIPFGGGARVCIGSHFAMLEVIAAVAVLLSSCTLRADPSPPPLQLDSTMRPAVPVTVEATARRSRISG
jgi:cytochrome P450